MSCVAVVGIKLNNVRLPGKNLRPLCGLPLYEHLWRTLKKCKRIDRILIDCSDLVILNAGIRFGFEVSQRDPDLNGPEVSGHDLIEALIPKIDEDIIVQIFVTTPLLSLETIDASILQLENSPDIDCVLPVYEVHDRFWYKDKPVSHDTKNLKGTQYMLPLYREAGFYIYRKTAFVKERARVTTKRSFMVVPPEECADIDSEANFLYAEALMHIRNEN